MTQELILIILITLVAFLYASVGHGGASGYLALMVIFGVSPLLMKPTALLMNLFVSMISFYQFYRSGFFKWKLLYPFVITSVPLSFIGAKIQINDHVYKIILAVCLSIAVIRLIGFFGQSDKEMKRVNLHVAMLLGAIIGLVSGMIGIGGGILLSPVLLLLHWAGMKETAATSAAFIFLNSLAGIAGAFSTMNQVSPQIFMWAMAGIIGGTAGAYFGSKKFGIPILKYILSAVLLFACFKLVIS